MRQNDEGKKVLKYRHLEAPDPVEVVVISDIVFLNRGFEKEQVVNLRRLRRFIRKPFFLIVARLRTADGDVGRDSGGQRALCARGGSNQGRFFKYVHLGGRGFVLRKIVLLL
jgi:hypothetical protein